MRLFANSLLALVFLVPACITAMAQHQQDGQGGVIRPGNAWRDDRGQRIQAHGGGILRYSNTFYWFGEDRSKDNDPAKAIISCYSSKDLVNWKFQRQVFSASSLPDVSHDLILQRPKVFYNARHHNFVMYVHLDGPGDAPPDGHKYRIARVAVAVSKTVDGEYTFVNSFRPLGQESRDIGQFVDDDGSAYLIFESRPVRGFYIARLSEDYLSVEKQMSFVHVSLEGGAIVHLNGLYYVIGSHLSGWRPNPNVYATSSSLEGPWTEFKDVAPKDANTYDSQSTFLLKVTGTKATTVIFMGDIWKEDSLWDSRYLWMPLEIRNGNLRLPPPHPWTINVTTGESAILP
jgi:hypothetical protein